MQQPRITGRDYFLYQFTIYDGIIPETDNTEFVILNSGTGCFYPIETNGCLSVVTDPDKNRNGANCLSCWQKQSCTDDQTQCIRCNGCSDYCKSDAPYDCLNMKSLCVGYPYVPN